MWFMTKIKLSNGKKKIYMFACQRVRNVELSPEIESSLAREFLPWGSQEAQPSSPPQGDHPGISTDLLEQRDCVGVPSEDSSSWCLPAKCRGARSGQRRERSPWGNVCFHGAQLRETEHILSIYVSKSCQTRTRQLNSARRIDVTCTQT